MRSETPHRAFQHVPKSLAPKDSPVLPASRFWPQAKPSPTPSIPVCSLSLLQPTVVARDHLVLSIDRHAHPSSRATQTVSSVAAIACYAPGFDTLRVTTLCLHHVADHVSQACSGHAPSQAACPLRFHPLTNKMFILSSLRSSPTQPP